MPKVRVVYCQSKLAMMYATKFIEEYAPIYPAAMNSFQQDLQNCLAYMVFPEGHHKHIRTTNLLERCFLGTEASDKGHTPNLK